jgi:hypothetical protein
MLKRRLVIKKKVPPKKYVVAGNGFQYTEYIRKNKLNPRDHPRCPDMRVLQKGRGFDMVLTGTWWTRKDTNEIYKLLQKKEQGKL